MLPRIFRTLISTGCLVFLNVFMPLPATAQPDPLTRPAQTPTPAQRPSPEPGREQAPGEDENRPRDPMSTPTDRKSVV